jgi:hypothetical protein
MLEVFRRTWLRGQCRLELSRTGVSVRRVGRGSKSGEAMPVLVERLIPDAHTASTAALVEPITAALQEALAKGSPVHATLGDELVRYFIVTPPGNSARMQDLQAATAVRFQVLYGESSSAWHIVGDWQANAPFLACAVSRRICSALQQAVVAQQACLVSVTPTFVAAWNRSRRQLGASTWLATLGDETLTLGLVSNAARPRLAAVRTLRLPQTSPSLAWLREQVARAALLDDLPSPSVLQIHGPQIDGWQEQGASTGEAGMTVRWCAPGNALSGTQGSSGSAATRLGWRGRAA